LYGEAIFLWAENRKKKKGKNLSSTKDKVEAIIFSIFFLFFLAFWKLRKDLVIEIRWVL